ncbi:hypothetical protein [Bradyrhizobium japonicum]|uniref:hypothetical protein n=1 Tax=Bradyrhizobium japonicum TaxID=375 RepID=UPI001BA76158|nr:hypothetical protein [Bradyrhizobium japonicum]MBR0914326.1 hypothetical protein [Bradyrhizobium japonicum]
MPIAGKKQAKEKHGPARRVDLSAGAMCASLRSMTAWNQSRRFASAAMTSGQPRRADIFGAHREISNGPTTEVQVGLLATCFLASGQELRF